MTATRNGTVRLLAFAVAVAPLTSSCVSKQDRVCQQLDEAFQDELAALTGKDFSSYEVTAFFSERLATCVHTEKAIVGVGTQIRDLSLVVIREEQMGLPPVLMTCDADGASSAKLDVVRRYGGRIMNVPYAEWQDDGFGGPPRSIATPEAPYSQAECERVLEVWLNERL